MRSDMFKVIVERPRRGVGYYRTLPNDYRAAKRFKLDEDYDVNDEFCGTKLPMRARAVGWDGKQLNENLSPLRRYLAKQVGRAWNDVYSEICSFLDTGSTIKQHVRQHLTDFVTLKTFIDEDGDLIAVTRWGHRAGPYNDLWVDSEGILRGQDHESYRTRWKARKEEMAAEAAKTRRTIDGVDYVFEKGTWFAIIKTEHVRSYPWMNRNTMKIEYRKEIYFEERKRTLSKKELRDLGLK